jgi:pimeloyl-ACP methyl ester carboxylesterase
LPSKHLTLHKQKLSHKVEKSPGLTKTLDIPSLLILPQQGLNRTAWQIQSYKKYLTSLEIKKIPGNHWAFLGEPETFNQTVAEFLSVQENDDV